MPSIANRGRGRRTINEINMVPFIDVMLVLLIIFMVTAPLITPSMIHLPSIGKAAKQPDKIIQVILSKSDDLIELKTPDTTLSLALPELARAVKRAQGDGDAATASRTAIVISADKDVRYENVVKVMDTLQRAGVQRIGLSVQLIH